jgi:hypothetical protein
MRFIIGLFFVLLIVGGAAFSWLVEETQRQNAQIHEWNVAHHQG